MNYRGKFEALYKKWELYLFRLFKLANSVENKRKFPIKDVGKDELLDPKGCKKSAINIPTNPFIITEEDHEVFKAFFTHLKDVDFEARDDEEYWKKLHKRIWLRMGRIKHFLGIEANTRICGQNKSNSRLLNEIDVYLFNPQAVPPLHKAILGTGDESFLKSFQKFLKDRSKITGLRSIFYYD